MHIETLLTFFATAVLLAFVPGPDNVFVMTQSVSRGARAGITVVLGLCTGLICHTMAVALGLAVIFERSQLAFDLLKYAGAAYLLYLAWQALFRSSGPVEAGDVPGPGRRLYLRGILMNISNPKVSIFFLAFLPQFVDRHAGHVSLQLLLLGAIFIVATLLAFASMALLAAMAGTRLGQSARAQQIMNRLAGVVFLGLALKLATTER